MAMLIALAMLVSAEREKRALAQRVQLLEGILPICMFCKKIRGPDGVWEQIESYITKHSAAHFSHGCCEKCGGEQYGEYFPAPVSKDAKPGQ
jgi:hypothetical protein